MSVSVHACVFSHMACVFYRMSCVFYNITYLVCRYGPLAWAGFAGVELVLRDIRKFNNMGHPLLANIRDGHWLMEFLVERLRPVYELREVVEWIEAHFAAVKTLAPGLRPKAFNTVVSAVYDASEWAPQACVVCFDSFSRRHVGTLQHTLLCCRLCRYSCCRECGGVLTPPRLKSSMGVAVWGTLPVLFCQNQSR